jgi:hypothetical protein
MSPHGTGRHGSFSDERKTDPPLDQTVVGHGPVRPDPRSRSVPERIGPSGPFQNSTSTHMGKVEK